MGLRQLRLGYRHAELNDLFEIVKPLPRIKFPILIRGGGPNQVLQSRLKALTYQFLVHSDDESTINLVQEHLNRLQEVEGHVGHAAVQIVNEYPHALAAGSLLE